MNLFGLSFHHFGLAVHGPEAAFRYLAALGYGAGQQLYDPLQQVNLAMRHHANLPDVEVIWPGDDPSPIDNLIRRGDGRIYHLCYGTKDPAGLAAGLKAAGIDLLLVREPRPAALFGGRAVSFHHIPGFGLIELLDEGNAN